MNVWTEVLQSYLDPQLPEAVGRLRVGRLATQALSHKLIDKAVYESVLSQKTYPESVEKLFSEIQGITKEHTPLLTVPELDPVVPSTDASSRLDQCAKNERGEAIKTSSDEERKQRTGRITVLDATDKMRKDLDCIQQLFQAGGVTAMFQNPNDERSLLVDANVADFSLVVGSAMPIATTFLGVNIIAELPQSQTSTLKDFIMNGVRLTCSSEVSPIVNQWKSWWLLHLQMTGQHVLELVTHLHKQLASDLSTNRESFAVAGSEDQFRSVCCVIGNSPLFFLRQYEQIPGMYLDSTKCIPYDSINEYSVTQETVLKQRQR